MLPSKLGTSITDMDENICLPRKTEIEDINRHGLLSLHLTEQ
jgi:hypothetical protein